VADGALSLDTAWLKAHPLPVHGEGTDKNSRGHVVAIGGSRQVPGGLLLTGEAALRAGAGKVQLGTVESCALGLGIAMPEAGVIALGENAQGEIDAEGMAPLAGRLDRCDCVVLGPAMTSAEAAGRTIDALLAGLLDAQALVLDAVALHGTKERADKVSSYPGARVLTPNPDELASLLDCSSQRIDADPASCAREAARRFAAVTVCKGDETYVATPEGGLLRYPGGGVGLATGGSGDVLAGIVAGLLARGADALTAAAWGVWLHGEAGRTLARRLGPIGFLARELPPLVPGLMRDLA
jgi:ADP-dependent NAD(P)H-hydrate dehydratase